MDVSVSRVRGIFGLEAYFWMLRKELGSLMMMILVDVPLLADFRSAYYSDVVLATDDKKADLELIYDTYIGSP